MTTERTAVDIAVVGAGLAGAATAWQLARRGRSVALIERDTPANSGGSSHGSARIFRYAYPDRFYAALVRDADADWAELADVAGQSLVNRCGAVDFGGFRSPRQLADVLADVGVQHELLAADAARERWPGIEFAGEVLWQPTAGVLDAESAVTAMVTAATAAGAQVYTDWEVARIDSTGAGFVLESTGGASISAERVVLAVGGWLPDWLSALPADVADGMPSLAVRQEQVFHFPYRDTMPSDSWPTVIHKSAEILTYALPGGRDAGFRGLKVAEFNGGRLISSAAASDGVVDPANRRRVVDYVARTFPGLVPEPYAEATCLFTMTPTEDFVLDGIDGFTVLSPCSGHGAKFAPLIGRLAADVVLGAAPPAQFRLRSRASAGG